MCEPGSEWILRRDAVLYVDWKCYKCKRTVALSNTLELDGRRYCAKCLETLTEEEENGKSGNHT